MTVVTIKAMPARRRKEESPLANSSAPVQVVAEILESYARRGIFRGFSPGPVSRGKASFRIVWHYDRVFELIFDLHKKKMSFPLLLPGVRAGSPLYRELKRFIKSRHAEELPEHRRIDTSKAKVQAYNLNGNVSLTLNVMGHDYEYGVRKLVHLVHEIFMSFLRDGSYYEYLVETFDLSPEGM
jgi:hypothetical protein